MYTGWYGQPYYNQQRSWGPAPAPRQPQYIPGSQGQGQSQSGQALLLPPSQYFEP